MKDLRLESVVFSIFLIILASISYNLGLSALLLPTLRNISNAYLYILCLSMPIGFVVIPNVISKRYKLFDHTDYSFDLKSSIILALFIILLDTVYFKSSSPLHHLIIATCEEYLFRYIILNILDKSMTKYQSIVVNSLLFSLILHLNYSFIDNLLFRFPLSLLLCMISKKYGLKYSIATHWLYNLVVSKFMF